MAALATPWAQAPGKQEWKAAYKAPGELRPVMLLTAYMDGDGLWRAVAEYRDHLGSWAAPSPFATLELAQQWAEARAEQIGSQS